MSDTPTIPPFVNKTMAWILRSPLHGIVSKGVLLITFTGRKSGTRYTTPVSYSQQGDEISIFTHATWWKNVIGGAPVTLYLRGREVTGVADAVAGDKQLDWLDDIADATVVDRRADFAEIAVPNEDVARGILRIAMDRDLQIGRAHV